MSTLTSTKSEFLFSFNDGPTIDLTRPVLLVVDICSSLNMKSREFDYNSSVPHWGFADSIEHNLRLVQDDCDANGVPREFVLDLIRPAQERLRDWRAKVDS